MGCAPSSPKLDAQAMLDKQREMMLQRQREFEQKRQQQQQQQPPQAMGARAPPPILTSVGKSVSQKSSQASTSAPPSPATPMKNTEPPSPLPSAALGGARPQSKEGGSRPQSKEFTALKPNADEGASPTSDENLAHEIENRARKYTIDQTDASKRRSKNVHDLGMYAKDVTRRTSFNPRPGETPFISPAKTGTETHLPTIDSEKSSTMNDLAMYAKDVGRRPSFTPKPVLVENVESPDTSDTKSNDVEKQVKGSPFSPEMQALMKAGHEAMMAAEAEKKAQRIAETEKVEAGSEDANSSDEQEQNEAQEKEPKEKMNEDFALDVEEARKKEEQDQAKADVVPGADDPNVARYLARDNGDRKSKNIHDLGQCKFFCVKFKCLGLTVC